MHLFRSSIRAALSLSIVLAAPPAMCADIIVSAQDGKFVRVDGRATFPQPAPPDSLVVIDASAFPPVIKGTVEGLEHTVQGPPQAVAVTPDGRWIAVSSMAGSGLTTDDPGRNKIGKLVLFEIKDGWATRIDEVAGAEAAQGVVFSQDSKQILLQMDVERAIGVFAVRDGKLVDTGARLKLAAGPVSIRSMPR